MYQRLARCLTVAHLCVVLLGLPFPFMLAVTPGRPHGSGHSLHSIFPAPVLHVHMELLEDDTHLAWHHPRGNSDIALVTSRASRERE